MNNKPPALHIAIDMDDVIVDFVGGLLNATYNETGISIDPDEITKWDLHPVLDPILGMSFWKWLRENERLWANFPAVPGAMGGIRRLREQGHYLEIVTAKPKWAEHNVWKWLGKWRPAIQAVTIVAPGECKADATSADVIVDDKPENCEHFTDRGRNAILYQANHNREYADKILREGSPIDHAADWQGVHSLIQEISNGR